MFINKLFSSGTIGPMHESMKRLLDFAKKATAGTTDPVLDFADIGAALGVSSATMTNWKARGISKEGAIDAERVYGCSGYWLISGKPPPDVRLTREQGAAYSPPRAPPAPARKHHGGKRGGGA